MSAPLNACNICNRVNTNPLVCKPCLIRWKVLYGGSEKREVAEATATKINTYSVGDLTAFPENPLFK